MGERVRATLSPARGAVRLASAPEGVDMVWVAVGEVMAQAFGIAISPIPVVLVILMLVSARAKVNGPAFLAGWMVGAALATGVAFVLADAAEADQGGSGSDGVLVGQLLLGILFLALAVKNWRSRPAAGEAPPTPKLFAAVDQMGAGRAFGLGVAACVANPKNLPLTLSAGASMAQSGLNGGGAVAALLMFVVMASVAVATPVIVYLVAGDRSAALLADWKNWLIANNATVMTVLFAVLGAKMLGTGLGVLG